MDKGGRPNLHISRTYVFSTRLGWRLGNPPPEVALRRSAEAVLGWCQEKVSAPLPAEMLALGPDEFEAGAMERVRTVGDLGRGVWALRLQYADRARGTRNAVAGRAWTAEVVLRTAPDQRIACLVQMSMAARPDADRTVAYDRPKLVEELERAVGLWKGFGYGPTVSAASAQELAELAGWPGRDLPIVVLTKPDEGRMGFEYVLDREAFGAQALGAAIVVSIDPDETYAWHDLVGRPAAVFNGAVLMIPPGWRPEDGSEGLRRYFPDQIEDWEHAGLRGEEAFRVYLVGSCVRDAVAHATAVPEELTFDHVLQEELDARRRLASQGELALLLEEENANLRREVADLKGKFENVEFEYELLREELERAQATSDELRAQLQRAWQRRREGGTGQDGYERPCRLQEVLGWCRQFSGRLELLGRAERGLKSGQYENAGLVADALALLADEGWSFHAGEEGGRERLEQACSRLGLRWGGSISDTRAGQEGEMYFVTYPPGSQRRRKLEWHLAKGNSHNPCECLRVYYLWDAERKLIVVGWLPGHLDNRMT